MNKYSFSALLLSIVLSIGITNGQEDDGGISTDVTETFFYLYTAQTGVENKVEIPKDVDSAEGEAALEAGDFNPERERTYVLIHGFWSDETWSDKFVPDLLEHGDCNIISVNWPTLALAPFFLTAAENAVHVGEYAGEFISDFIASTGVGHDQIHVVGHSFGSQAGGHLGRTVDAITGEKLDRLSVLEPAFPWYRSQDPSLTVGRNDAKFVDVWHTNSGRLIDACLSFPEALGHLDFYPSGGDHQPGCTEICGSENCTDDKDIIDFLKGGCSHSRSHEFFLESINGEIPFTAYLCDSYDEFLSGSCQTNPTVEMGLAMDMSSTEGTYFLDVNAETPFAQG